MLSRVQKSLLILAGCALIASCDAPYYWQAARGQLDLMQRKQPIREVVQLESTPKETREALEYLLQVRTFALAQLQLEDNGSYLDYVDLKRDYVSWNVFATPELSMQNHTWCYPIAGCVSYRGYFDETEAKNYARQLQSKGFDTYVSGVGAYSTLGWFNDPVLSTFLQRDKLSMAALLFHELAHQVLYVKDDTEFNESFASSVESILLERWSQRRELLSEWKHHQQMQERQAAFTQLILEHQEKRDRVFKSDLSDPEKRHRKAELIVELQQEYLHFKQIWQFNGYDRWFASGLNNAQLSTVAAYNGLKPGFLALYENTDRNLTEFIEECRQLATLEQALKQQRLNQLASDNIVYTQE